MLLIVAALALLDRKVLKDTVEQITLVIVTDLNKLDFLDIMFFFSEMGGRLQKLRVFDRTSLLAITNLCVQ